MVSVSKCYYNWDRMGSPPNSFCDQVKMIGFIVSFLDIVFMHGGLLAVCSMIWSQQGHFRRSCGSVPSWRLSMTIGGPLPPPPPTLDNFFRIRSLLGLNIKDHGKLTDTSSITVSRNWRKDSPAKQIANATLIRRNPFRQQNCYGLYQHIYDDKYKPMHLALIE